MSARLDTCADVNIMPASIYRLMFKDAEMKKLVPSELEIWTYTTDTVKIVGFCRFYLVHQDSKKLVDVTLFVAINYGSMLQNHPCAWTYPAQIKARLPTS